MDRDSTAVLGMFLVFVLIILGLDAWDQHDRSAMERATDACAGTCGTHLVARVTVDECLCRESAE